MASYDEKFDSSLDLLRRLDPKQINENLNKVCTLIQNDDNEESAELAQDLLSTVDVPLKIQKCSESGKNYLCCDYNRDGDSYRSPWSNKYYPEVSEQESEDTPYPSRTLRQLEIKANESFEIYCEMYYEGDGISSIYFWDTAEIEGLEEGFAGVALFKKETDNGAGKWNSIHVFEVIPEDSGSSLYKLTSSVILDLQKKTESPLSLSGNITRQVETSQSLRIDNAVNLETAHLINIGTLVENSENNLRNLLQAVYFDKLKDIITKDLRSLGKSRDDSKQAEVIKGISSQ